MPPQSLPPELWLSIFRYATLSPTTPILFATSYRPFQLLPLDLRDEALAMKGKLARVCRKWRELSAELLYEDVAILSGNAGHLRLVLRNWGQDALSQGRLVHRVYLPYTSSLPQPETSYPTDVVKFIQECLELKVLARPSIGHSLDGQLHPLQLLRIDYPAEECPPLSSLERLDWWHHNDASRSGGINSLVDVLQAAPNLQYISLGGHVWLSLMRSSSLMLPHLTTLRLRRVNILFVQLICRWALPSLKNIIIDTFPRVDVLESLWEKFGDQVETVELGRNLKFYVNDTIRTILSGCPNLRVLNYHIFFIGNSRSQRITHNSLETLGIHCHPNGVLHDDLGAGLWQHLDEHFTMLGRQDFTSLKRVSLHGSWGSITANPRFDRITAQLREQGCSVVFAED